MPKLKAHNPGRQNWRRDTLAMYLFPTFAKSWGADEVKGDWEAFDRRSGKAAREAVRAADILLAELDREDAPEPPPSVMPPPGTVAHLSDPNDAPPEQHLPLGGEQPEF